MGGVPYYMEKLKRGESVVQAINRLCFSKDGILHDEFENVFASLYNHSDRHEAIVIELSKVRKGLTRNDLSKKASIPTGGTLTNTLDELIESGFVSKYLPIGNKKKDPLYRLVDEYAMFYLKFIKDTKASGADVWSTIYNSQSYVSWSGFSFETVCLKHINQIKDALGIRGIYSEQGSWIEKNDKNGAHVLTLINQAFFLQF